MKLLWGEGELDFPSVVCVSNLWRMWVGPIILGSAEKSKKLICALFRRKDCWMPNFEQPLMLEV